MMEKMRSEIIEEEIISAMKSSLGLGHRRSSGSRSSTNWIDTSLHRISSSGRRDADEDEEALKWASLERLPTYERMRTTILEEMKGGKIYSEQVDLRTVGQQKLRHELLTKLFKESSPDDDNAKFLRKLRGRIDKVGLELPTIEVRYENLNVEADVHVGSRALPTLSNSAVNGLQGLIGSLGITLAKKTKISILQDVSGIIEPARMTLLLGPPSSGKTTLLLALAGKLDPSLKVGGKVTYNGHEFHEFVPEKTSGYVSQTDTHAGEMTVREILEYSAKCQGVGTRYEFITELCKREKELGIHPEANVDCFLKAAAMKETYSSLITDYMLKILGLDICADTLYGDNMHRGISGGQKKRVTTGEMIVGPMKTLFMDEISTGLDSSTTFQIVKCLGDITHALQSTTVISLLQPAPETYDLFDDVILLSEGQIAYHGPREFILSFFEECGFKCPPRKGVADFLQEVTSRKDQEQYWADKAVPYRFVPVKQFAETFQQFHLGLKTREELATPYNKEESHEAALVFERQSLSSMEIFKTNLEKEWLLMKRNKVIYIFKTFQIAVMAFIAMSLYFRTHMEKQTLEDVKIYDGALFFGVLNIMFNGYAELAMTIDKLPVFFKQRDMLFFPAWSYSLASMILRIPISIIEAVIWIIITYYSIGFAPAFSRFTLQWFLFICVHQMSSALFRMMAGLCRSLIVANTGGTSSLLVIFVLGGFLIPRKRIKPWWIWGYWISPLAYAQNGIAVLEFTSPHWSKPFGNTTESMGAVYLDAASLFKDGFFYWISVFVLIAYTIIFNIIYTVAVTYLRPIGKPQAVVSDEQKAEAHANCTGEVPTAADVTPKRSILRRDALRHFLTIGLSSSRSGVKGNEDTRQSAYARPPQKRGMILPFLPLNMTFRDVKYFVKMPSQMKQGGIGEDKLQLLKSITGAFRPGILTALVGVSGAGKTTLMDVLAGRKTGGEIEGDICISGYPKKQETFARISGYCEQNDVHSPQLTVCESLLFSAWLRLPQELSKETKSQFVEEVVNLVELMPLKDALVGSPGETGLSTEQRKRLTIAVELVANPSIIFMDEPTSGLDARAAAIVMRTVRNTVDTGRTVVCTIHQPSIDIFEAFDELLLMKRGGHVVYAGPLGRHSHKLIEFFEAVPGVPKITEGYNPATWMLEVTSEAVEQRLGIDFAEVYASSGLCQSTTAAVEELSAPSTGPAATAAPEAAGSNVPAHDGGSGGDLHFNTQYAMGFWGQVRCCLWKQHLTYWRSPSYNSVRVFFTIAAALLFGTVFWQMGSNRNDEGNVIGVMAAMYGAVIFIGINNATTIQPVVDRERIVFYREKAAGLYSAGPYAIAQVLIEVPYVFMQMIMYSMITYSMIGLEWSAAKLLWYMYFMLTTFFYFTFYGMMAVGLTPDLQIATILSSFFYQIWNLYSGFLISYKKMPVWAGWYYWLCPIAWTLYGVIVSQFGDVDSILKSRDPTAPTQTVSEFVDTIFGFRYSFLPVVASILLIFPVVFALVFVFSIKFLNFQNR